MRTVPSCARCNHGASLDEQYFLTLIGHVSPSPSIAAKLRPGGVIDRALSRSPALEERLLKSLGVDEETGEPFIRPETARVHRVVKKIALGLFALRYGRVLSPETIGQVSLYPYQPKESRPVPYVIATFTERFKSKRWCTVQRGVFSYIFVRDPMHSDKVWGVMDIHRSLWGVVHFPNPKTSKVPGNPQLSLFETDAA